MKLCKYEFFNSFFREINKDHIIQLGDLNFFDKVIDVGLWISFTFHFDQTGEGVMATIRENSIPTMSFEEFKDILEINVKQNEFPCPTFIKTIANKNILQYTECVATLMSFSNIMEDKSLQDKEKMYHSTLSRLLLDLFIDKESDSIYNKKAREKLKYEIKFTYLTTLLGITVTYKLISLII